MAETLKIHHKLFQDPQICKLPTGVTQAHTVLNWYVFRLSGGSRGNLKEFQELPSKIENSNIIKSNIQISLLQTKNDALIPFCSVPTFCHFSILVVVFQSDQLLTNRIRQRMVKSTLHKIMRSILLRLSLLALRKQPVDLAKPKWQRLESGLLAIVHQELRPSVQSQQRMGSCQ